MSRTVLPRAQDFALMTLVRAEYTSSGLSDSAFARYAAEKLGLPMLKNSHVKGAREAFSIPLNIPPIACGPLPDRLAALEQRVFALEHLAERFLAYMGEPTE